MAMNKITICFVAALLVVYAVGGDAQDLSGMENRWCGPELQLLHVIAVVSPVCRWAGGQAMAGGARRLLNAGSSLDGSGKNAPDGVSSSLPAYSASCNHQT